MTENFQPSEDIFDDEVEGHGLKMKLDPITIEDEDDVEGHRINQ